MRRTYYCTCTSGCGGILLEYVFCSVCRDGTASHPLVGASNQSTTALLEHGNESGEQRLFPPGHTRSIEVHAFLAHDAGDKRASAGHATCPTTEVQPQKSASRNSLFGPAAPKHRNHERMYSVGGISFVMVVVVCDSRLHCCYDRIRDTPLPIFLQASASSRSAVRCTACPRESWTRPWGRQLSRLLTRFVSSTKVGFIS